MASLLENIATIKDALDDIKQSLINKNLSVPAGTPIADYAALIDSLDTRNIQPYQEWLILGGVDYTLYTEVTVFTSGKYIDLLNTETSAAYAAYISTDIATILKGNSIYLRNALLCDYNYMFINSEFDFDEHVDDLLEINEPTTSKTDPRVSFSADRCTNPDLSVYPPIYDVGYYGYMAFDGSLDSTNLGVNYENRHIWSAMGTNQWVQYNYSSSKFLYKIHIYPIRDNFPLSVKIEGSNNNEDFTILGEWNLFKNIERGEDNEPIINPGQYEEVICCTTTAYRYYRFTISDSYYSGTCNVGDIVLYTFR